MPAELPLAPTAAGPRGERADAARNRARILEVAAALVEERGIEHVSMQDIARAAGVGAGTIYRRFGDRAGLAATLLDESTRALQDAAIGGPPPLGPGAPAAERLLAFGDAYLDLLERHAELMAAGIDPAEPDRGPLVFALTHVAVLLREAAPHLDADYFARVLMDALSPGRFLYERRVLGWDLERVRGGWAQLVGAVTAPTARPRPDRRLRTPR